VCEIDVRGRERERERECMNECMNLFGGENQKEEIGCKE
jgi:hypothetical protein